MSLSLYLLFQFQQVVSIFWSHCFFICHLQSSHPFCFLQPKDHRKAFVWVFKSFVLPYFLRHLHKSINYVYWSIKFDYMNLEGPLRKYLVFKYMLILSQSLLHITFSLHFLLIHWSLILSACIRHIKSSTSILLFRLLYRLLTEFKVGGF